MNKVAIMTDTASQMTKELADEYNIKLAPLSVILDGKACPETEIDLAWYYEQIPKWKEADKMPTTSSVSPGYFLETYRELSQKAEAILYIGHSVRLGMSVNAALQAKKMAEDELPQTEIEVIDSGTALGAEMFIALEAARAAAAGKNLSEVVEVANNMMARVKYIFLADNLDYIASGGRILDGRPWAEAKISTKALLETDAATGKVHAPLARYGTKTKAVEGLLEIMKERCGDKKLHVAINHVDAPAEAEQLKELTLSRFPSAEVFVTPVYPLVTRHTGLGSRNYSW